MRYQIVTIAAYGFHVKEQSEDSKKLDKYKWTEELKSMLEDDVCCVE